MFSLLYPEGAGHQPHIRVGIDYGKKATNTSTERLLRPHAATQDTVMYRDALENNIPNKSKMATFFALEKIIIDT